MPSKLKPLFYEDKTKLILSDLITRNLRENQSYFRLIILFPLIKPSKSQLLKHFLKELNPSFPF